MDLWKERGQLMQPPTKVAGLVNELARHSGHEERRDAALISIPIHGHNPGCLDPDPSHQVEHARLPMGLVGLRLVDQRIQLEDQAVASAIGGLNVEAENEPGRGASQPPPAEEPGAGTGAQNRPGEAAAEGRLLVLGRPRSMSHARDYPGLGSQIVPG